MGFVFGVTPRRLFCRMASVGIDENRCQRTWQRSTTWTSGTRNTAAPGQARSGPFLRAGNAIGIVRSCQKRRGLPWSSGSVISSWRLLSGPGSVGRRSSRARNRDPRKRIGCGFDRAVIEQESAGAPQFSGTQSRIGRISPNLAVWWSDTGNVGGGFEPTRPTRRSDFRVAPWTCEAASRQNMQLDWPDVSGQKFEGAT